MVKQAQKLAGDTRTLADVVDEMRGVGGDYDLVADLFGGKSLCCLYMGFPKLVAG